MKKLTRIFGVLLLCLALVGAMSAVFSAEEVAAVAEETAEYFIIMPPFLCLITLCLISFVTSLQ